MKIIRIQLSEFVDQIVNGHEMTKLPYPFFVTEDGDVIRQDFWKGEPEMVVGFARDSAVQEINLPWHEAREDLQQVVGMYLVAVNSNGSIGSYDMAISSINVIEPAAPNTESPEGN